MPDTYVELPDGRYVQVPAGASPDQLAAFKNKLAASFPDLKTGRGMQERAQEQAKAVHPEMNGSVLPAVVRATTSVLPAAGAIAGGLLSSPGVVTSAAGAGLGAAGGQQVRLLANRGILGPEETSPISAKGLIDTGVEGASYAVPAAATEAATRALLAQPMETGVRMAAPEYGVAMNPGNLAAQRAATREGEEKLGAFMNRGYKPTIAGPSVVLPENASLSSNPKPTGQATIVAPSESPTTSTGPKVQFAAPKPTPSKPSVVQIRPAGSVDSDVSYFPEPRPMAPGEKPGSMYSVPRDQLRPSAAAGKPGAIDVLRDLGNPIIVTPRSTVGYPGSSKVVIAGPEEEQELPPIRDRAAD